MSTSSLTSGNNTSALDLVRRKDGGLTLGIELPLDNDWSPKRVAEGRPFGVPDLRTLRSQQERLAFPCDTP